MTYPQSSSSIDLIYDFLSYLLNSLPLIEGEQLSSTGVPYQVVLPLDPLSFHDTQSILLFQAVVLHPLLSLSLSVVPFYLQNPYSSFPAFAPFLVPFPVLGNCSASLAGLPWSFCCC